ncbi:MAG: fluoride efflux transporter CrcB [Thermomicrobiales bacterium]
MDALWIAAGAVVGANLRYYVGQWVAAWLGVGFPYGTLLVNLSGSFLIGVIATIFTERLLVDSHWRLLLVVGLIGGYTTFSSYALETISLIQSDRWLTALTYVLGSTLLSLGACALGIVAVRASIGG